MKPHYLITPEQMQSILAAALALEELRACYIDSPDEQKRIFQLIQSLHRLILASTGEDAGYFYRKESA